MLKSAIFSCKLRATRWFLLLSILTSIYADSFNRDGAYQVYFTPLHNCTVEITRAIQSAQHSIYVQAYFLTSEPIVSALVMAKTRQVDVNVMVDKRPVENKKGIRQLLEGQIPVWIDQAPGIAHNKVMIIDEHTVITGSFNFTYSANYRNRENILLIRDKGVAKRYLENWHRCKLNAVREKALTKRRKQGSLLNKQIEEKLNKLLILIVIGIGSVVVLHNS